MDNLIQQAIAKVRNTARQILDRTTIDESIGGAINNASNFIQDRRAETRNFLSGAPLQLPGGLQSTYNNPIPSFSNPNSDGLGPFIFKNIVNFGVNIPNSIFSPVATSGVDLLQNTSRAIGGKPLLNYDQARGGLTRTAMQLSTLTKPQNTQRYGINNSAQEVIGNLAEPANAVFNLATMGEGGPVQNLFKMPVEQGLKQMALRGLKVGAVEGGTMGLLGGLEHNRTNTQNYFQGVAGETAGGALIGGALGGAIGAGTGIYKTLEKSYQQLGFKPEVATQLAKKHFVNSDSVPVKLPSAQTEYWAKINSVLKRPLDTPVFSDDLKAYVNKVNGIPNTQLSAGFSIKNVNRNGELVPEFKPPYQRGDKAQIAKQLDELLQTNDFNMTNYRGELPARQTAMNMLESAAKETHNEPVPIFGITPAEARARLAKVKYLEDQLANADIVKAGGKMPQTQGKGFDTQIEYAKKFSNYQDFVKSLNSMGAEVSTVNPRKNQLIQDITNQYGSLENFWRISNGKEPKLSSSQLGLNSQPTLKITPKEADATPKTVQVWRKSPFSDKGSYQDVPVLRKEENITLYQGGNGEQRQFWTPSKKYAEQFGAVKEKTGTFYKVDNGNRVTNVYVEAPSTADLPADRSKIWPGSELYRPATDLPAQPLEAPAISNEAKMANKVVPVAPEPKAPELLPWELPQDVSANTLPKKITPTQLGTDKIKAELNQPESVQVQPQKIISPTLEKDIKNTEKLVPGKVNLLDWLRTPDRVLAKLGLGKEAQAIRESYNGYLDQLPKELNKINKWYEQVKQDPTASQRIFKYLDGQEGVTLNSVEKKVAGEMQTYLKEWADKLDLPYDNRIASYITHIFEPDFIKKDFDEDIAKIIADKIPGSVYDPFLQQRLGAKGYVEDAFRALDAYVKRATRKVNMDPALEVLQKGGERLPLESMKYVKSYADRINMRPTMVDSLLDNLVKDSPIGYKLGQRPVTSVSKKIRQAVYRGTLGLNFGSALRNLTQGVNTYAKLGERYTAEGYIKVIPEILSGSNELKASGVLRDNIIQDRQISAFKGVMEKLDSGLFAFFNLAEKINRGSAYFGAKAKFLNEGLTEAQAIKRAVDLVRQTQFTFGSVDTPVALQSDLVKTFTQFQSFNIKQTEFLTEMIKNKELAGGIRWAGANLLLIASVGKLIGLSPKDMIPFGSILSGDSKLGETPPIKLATDVYKAAINAPDKYGNTSDDPALARIGNALGTNAPAFIPGGVQIKKTLQGVQGVQEHGSYNKSGNLQYPIDETTGNYVRAGLFGKNNLTEAQNYFDTKPSPLSEKQTARYKSLTGQAQKDFYTQTLAQRAQNKALDAQKEALKNGTTVPAPASENMLQKISNVINPKPATPTTTSPAEDTRFMYQGVDGSIRTIDTAKINAMPSTSNVEALIKRKEAYKLVDDVYKLPQEQQAKAFSQLGISQADASYYRIANNDTDVKDAFVRERLTELAQKGGTHDDMLKTLIGLRYQLNGKMIATDTVIKNLYNDGLLTSQEYTELKNLKVSNGGIRTKRLKAKKGRKPAFTKVKMGRLKRIKVPKLKAIKLKAIKLNLPRFKTKAKLANQKPR